MKQLLVRSELCIGCKSCELACAVAHSESKTIFGAIMEPKFPRKRVHVETDGRENQAFQCRQCTDMPCVHACMAGAMYKDPETQLIQVNEQKCVGCYMCVMVCPYGAITEGRDHKVVKCDRCLELNYNPACVSACPTKALQYIEVDQFAKSSRKNWLNHLREVENYA